MDDNETMAGVSPAEAADRHIDPTYSFRLGLKGIQGHIVMFQSLESINIVM